MRTGEAATKRGHWSQYLLTAKVGMSQVWLTPWLLVLRVPQHPLPLWALASSQHWREAMGKKGPFTSQSKTKWVFRLDGCLVPSWRCREIWDPLLPYESWPARGLHGTIRTPFCTHLSPRHTWLRGWLRPSRGEEHGGRTMQETWV